MSEADRHMARVHGDPGQTKADRARRKQARINELANLTGIPAATLAGQRQGICDGDLASGACLGERAQYLSGA